MSYDDAMYGGSMKKRFGKDVFVNLEDAPASGLPGSYIPTPAETLNKALGIGGVKKGAMVEIFGQPGMGKTTLALEILKSVQDTGMPVQIHDAESMFDVGVARAIGLNLSPDWCKYNQETQTENVLNQIYEACKAGIGAVLLDSVPSLTPEMVEEKADITESNVGGNAKILGAALKRIKSVCDDTGTIVILINQIRYKVGKDAQYGNPETRPGGQATRYSSNCEIKLSKASPQPPYLLGEDGKPIGFRVKADVTRLKWAAPHRVAEYDLIYGRGIDGLGSTLDVATDMGVVQRKGAWYSFHEKQLGQGRAASRLFLAENPDVFAEIKAAVWSSKNELQETPSAR